MRYLRSETEIEQAMQAYAPDIVRLAFAYVKNTADAQDLAQEVYLCYMLKSPPFADASHEKAWLCG